ncbi:PLB1 [Bugula neritina]|uniref:Phospholipase B1, membrane-associated n=1 Tax=Bugula neritina TaxID=10212 RepID=A0A7J7IYQ3_BUGNE|nr:PLB1 [Bugula neritina]
MYYCILISLLAAASGSFLCPDGDYTSAAVPTSVHKLKIGDIKVVAGMGDSITSGLGANSTNMADMATQYRGHSFSAGGDSSYKDQLTTFPNILKLFNPDIYGYSTGTGDENTPNSKFNVAQFHVFSSVMPSQADDLVKKMKADSNIDFENDWKVVTIFCGGADVCKACGNTTQFPASLYKENIEAALDILHQKLPRTLVNFVQIFDVNKIRKMMVSDDRCAHALGVAGCSCPLESDGSEMTTLSQEYTRAVEDLISTGKYDSKDDFTVVIQPFLHNMTMPRLPSGKYDLSYFAPDCFHLSSKGHGTAGISLWDNMMQPLSAKQTDISDSDTPICPTTEYIPTRKNGANM